MQKTLMLTKVKGLSVQHSINLWISFWNIVCMVVTPCAQFSGRFSALGEHSDITVATCNSGCGGSGSCCVLRGVWGLWVVWGVLLSPDALCWSRDRFQGPGEKSKRLRSPYNVFLNPHPPPPPIMGRENGIDELFYGQWGKISALVALLIMGDFNFPDINWDYHSAVVSKAGKFPKHVEVGSLLYLWQEVIKGRRPPGSVVWEQGKALWERWQ